MTEQPAVWMQPPSRPMLRVMNPVLRRVLTSGLASRLPPALAVLEFTGRRSGRALSIPVGAHELGDDLVVFTEAPWRLNFAGGRDVTLVRGQRRRHSRGVLVEDAAVVAAALGEIVARVGPRNLAMRTAPGHHITHEDLRRLSRGMVQLMPS